MGEVVEEPGSRLVWGRRRTYSLLHPASGVHGNDLGPGDW